MSLRFCRALFHCFFALLLLIPAAGMARADGADQAALEAQKDQLFQRMLANPADLDATFDYANVAAQLGDNEAALSALERMLLFNPNLPRVDLELGALYFRMGSSDVARSYFDKALAANPPPEVQQRVNQYLTLIDQQLSPTRLTGTLFFGAQYQSDANVAPATSTIASPIGPVLLSNQFVKMADWNIFGAGSLLYTYDLGTQDHDTIEVTGNGLMNHYMQVSRLDLAFGEVTAGPRFRFPQFTNGFVQGATLKPYVILNEVGLGENQYFFTYGTGIEATGIVFDDIALKSFFEFRQKKFSNAPDRPASTALDGNDKVFSLSASKPITANSALSAEFDYVNQSTRVDYYANQSYAVAAAYHIRYEAPDQLAHLPMETTIYGSRLWSFYDAPDPCCNTSPTLFFSPSTRTDRRWHFGLTQGLQVTDNIELMVQVSRDIVSSNLPLYGYTSNSVVLGSQIRF